MLVPAVIGWLALATPAAVAQDTGGFDSAAMVDSMRAFEGRLAWQTGRITLKGGFATLDLPAGWRFLGPTDARKVLVQAWHNPPREAPLGMLFPPDNGVFDNDYAIVIEYSDDGYVKDDDAATIDYDKLLKQMQESARADNPERKKAGYATIELLGWAEPPHYDRDSHKLYWAKQLQFSDDSAQTLNYNIRALGRHGVLVMNAVADMAKLPAVKGGVPTILAAVDFTDGNRYADYSAKSGDKVAAYGIAALIAGGVAAKAGLFKGLIALLIALKKFIVIAAAGFVAWMRKVFGKKSAAPRPPPPASPTVLPPPDAGPPSTPPAAPPAPAPSS